MKTEYSFVRDSLVHIPMNHNVNVVKEKLVEDFKILIVDLEDLLNAPTAVTGDKATYVRARIQENLDRVRLQLAAAEVATIVKAKATSRVADEYIFQDT